MFMHVPVDLFNLSLHNNVWNTLTVRPLPTNLGVLVVALSQSTSSLTDHHAKTYPSLESEPDWTAADHQCSSRQHEFFRRCEMQQMELFPESQFGRTSPELSVPTTETTSAQSSKPWMTSGHWRNGGMCWTHNSSESPNGVDACSSSLSSILQSSNGPGMAKYFLSAKAAEGILRRSTNRGKKLPPLLERALATRAQSASTGKTGADTEPPTSDSE